MSSQPIPEVVQTEPERPAWLDRSIQSYLPSLSTETLLIALLLVAAIFTRFYMLGDRVMSHDETNHVVPSWELYQGQGYRVDPITHGPLQFHLLALSYFLFGDSDFTSRIPAALFSIATVAFAWWGYRRYLGRVGALLAALGMLISPYMLYYGRYTRNEAFIGLFGVVMLYAILRYLESGQRRFLFLLTVSLALHFTAKETAYIYTAEALIFLGLYLLSQIFRKPWARPAYLRGLTLALVLGTILLAAILGVGLATAPATTTATPGAAAASPTPTSTPGSFLSKASPVELGLIGLLGIDVLAALFCLLAGYGLAGLRQERSFEMLILVLSLVMPLLTAFPVRALGWNPLDYSDSGIVHTAVILVPMVLIGIALGWWWNRRTWLISAAIFYSLFTVFFTTFFTNGVGFVVGLVGALGYWLEQQGVHRGEQPLYYFALIQIPMYEFLPAIGTLIGLFLAIRHKLFSTLPFHPYTTPPEPKETETAEITLDENGHEAESSVEVIRPQPVPVMALLLFWAFISLVAFSLAGEKMPWLTVHITLPMILAAGWAFGYLVTSTPWKQIRQNRGWIALLVGVVFVLSLAGTLASILSTQPPFQGKTLEQLQATANFVLSAIVLLASGVGLVVLTKTWTGKMIGRSFVMIFLAILAILTLRDAWRASFINYNTAKEYLVYAHAAAGPKEVLQQVEEISRRTTGGLDIAVAYDDETLYPFWWYFRNYPNKVWYAGNPTRDLRNDPIIIVGDKNYGKIEPIVGQAYYSFETMRLWWPNQDYFNLSGARIGEILTNPALRAGVFDIWLNADYTQYAKATKNTNLTLTTWQPSNKMRIYIRKDIVAQMWKYGVAPSSSEAVADPYEKQKIALSADQVVGAQGSAPGQFQSPRGIAVAPDGSVYMADSKNNRIQHLSTDGKVLQAWGTFADAAQGAAPGGTFNEPWGVGVGPDGSVYVADTWNNRIQKFTAAGKFVSMWGYFGQAEQPEAFWGPRDVAVNAQGQVLVADTGNKRVVVFDANGKYVTQFGTEGNQPGQLNEPVGLALTNEGQVYVADTWNQRIQEFAPDSSGQTYSLLRTWEVAGWYGESLDNKPYLAVDGQGHVFAADPEAYRILEFAADGTFLRTWGDYGSGADGLGLVSGVGVDPQGNVWVSDTGNNRLMHFTLPQ